MLPTLEREDLAGVHRVTITSPLGRVSTYEVTRTAAGEKTRRVVSPANLTASKAERPDEVDTTTRPDGSTARVTLAGHPRWGTAARFPKRTQVAHPGGPTRLIARDRTMTGGSAVDPLSFTSITDTTWINPTLVNDVPDAASPKYVRTYVKATRTETWTTPEGRQFSRVLDPLGRTASVTAPGVATQTLGYDAVTGQLASALQGARSTSWTYAADGMLSATTNAIDEVASFDWDDAGRMLRATRPDLEITSFAYDDNGNLEALTPPGRTAHEIDSDPLDLISSYTPPPIAGTGPTAYTHDADRMLDLESRPGAVTLDYQYEPLTGRPTAVVGPTLGLETQQRTREYDAAGRISALRGSMFIGGAAEQSLLFGYAGGLRTSETFAGAVVGVVATTYDNHFRVATETINGGLGVTFGYDRDSLLTSAGELTIGRDLPSGRILTISNTHAGHAVVEHRTYDTFGAVASMDYRRDGTSFFRLAFTRDDLGRIATKTETVDGATHVFAYEYDEAGRLTDVTRDGTDVEHYEYDPNGNRLIGESYGTSAAGTYDAQDRLVSYGPHTYSYAPNGELESRSGPVPLSTEYDVFGNLRTVATGGETRTYVADAKGRRVQRLVDGDFDAAWLWRSQLQPVAALDEAGAVEQRYQYADGVNVPDLVIDVATGARWRLVKDQVGSVRMVVDVETGAVVRRLDFDSFGRVLAASGDLDAVPFGFAGGLWEPATGLVRFGARDYDPETGRFVLKDGAGFAGGVNFYAYAKNDPIDYVDVDGRSPILVGAFVAGFFVKTAIDFIMDANADYDEAGQITEGLYGDNEAFWGGPGDAFQHCVASCMTTQSSGECLSELAGEYNELGGDNAPEWDKPMVRLNNAAGRSCGDTKDCVGCCQELMLTGGLDWHHTEYER